MIFSEHWLSQMHVILSEIQFFSASWAFQAEKTSYSRWLKAT